MRAEAAGRVIRGIISATDPFRPVSQPAKIVSFRTSTGIKDTQSTASNVTSKGSIGRPAIAIASSSRSLLVAVATVQ